MKIKHLIKKSFETTYPYAGIESIEKSLKDNSFLVVLASGSFLGILTPSDIIESPHQLVIDCLHDKPRVDLEQDIESVLILMKESGNPVLPAFDGDKFVGVISQTVITDYLSEYRKELERKISEHAVELAKANEKLKREREELKASGARFRNLVETTSDWIWEVDPNGIYTYASPKVKDLLGYEADEIIGKTPFDFMPPDEAKRIMRIFQAIVKEKKSFSGLENTNLKKDGQLVMLETSGVPIFSSVGNFMGYRGIDRDVTERKKAVESLQESEATIRALMNTPVDSVLLLDPHGIILDINKTGAQRVERRVDELIGMCAYELLPPELANKRRARIDEVLRSGVPVRFEDERAGIWFDHSFHSIFDAQGKVAKIAVVSRDITDRKKAEEELKNSEEFRKRLIESSNDCTQVLDLEGRLLFMSKRGQQLLDIEDITPYLNKLWMDFWKGDDNKVAREAVSKAASGGSGHFEGFYPTNKGTPKWWDVKITPIITHEGTFERLLCVTRDITERKRAEESLMVSETRYRRLFETAQDGILLLDSEIGQITDVNPFLINILGYSHEKILGKKLWEIGLFKDIESCKKAFSELQEKGYIRYEDLPLETKDGRHIDVEFVSNDYLANGKKVIQCNIRDITERKMMAEELRKYREHLEREVEARTRELKKSHALLLQTEKMAGLGTLASGIAHEVNNPLASILTYVQLMQSKINDGILTMDKVMEYAGRMEKVTKHCMNTIQGLLDFSRETKETKQPISLTEVIEASISLLFHQLELQNIKVSKELEGSTILANKNQLMQVFVNMLTNAKDAMPEGGKITIAAQKADGYVKIVIADTGTGIPEEYLYRIFDPFFTTKEVGKGTGVGLYLCYRIVENLGGTLEVGSEVGKGTTFTIKLPV